MLSYSEFLSESKDDMIALAEKLSKNHELSKVLDDCLEGKHTPIQIIITPGSASYVGVALNDGNSVSEVYQTGDPRVALVAIVMKNTGKKTSHEIISVLEIQDVFLHYVVFAGNKAMSPEDVVKRYNSSQDIYPGDAVSFYSSTPIKKNY